MKASVRHHGKVTVVDLSGKITIGDGDIKLRETVNALLDEGRKSILLNLHGVSYMDSAGIGELAACKKRALEKEGEIKLLKPKGKYHLAVETVIELMFGRSVFEDEKQAIGSF